MPIIERRPDPAFARFEQHIEEVVRATLRMPAPIQLKLKRADENGVLEFVAGGIATSVPLDTNIGSLYLSVHQDLRAIREQRRRYRLRTVRYSYRLARTEDVRADALLRWEYAADTADHVECRHHLHVAAAISLAETALALEPIHLPTGWVLIEHLLRFLFHDLRVTPRTDEWPGILRASETKFYEEFTSKRYKTPGLGSKPR